MNCFARFKYSSSKPVFRVHIWDLFDKANLKSKNFAAMIDLIGESLCDMYTEQGFDSEDEETEMHKSEADFEKASNDSANAHLA